MPVWFLIDSENKNNSDRYRFDGNILDGCDVCGNGICEDVDADGVCDAGDHCVGGDDNYDSDADGKPDDCDVDDDYDGDDAQDSYHNAVFAFYNGCDESIPSYCSLVNLHIRFTRGDELYTALKESGSF